MYKSTPPAHRRTRDETYVQEGGGEEGSSLSTLQARWDGLWHWRGVPQKGLTALQLFGFRWGQRNSRWYFLARYVPMVVIFFKCDNCFYMRRNHTWAHHKINMNIPNTEQIDDGGQNGHWHQCSRRMLAPSSYWYLAYNLGKVMGTAFVADWLYFLSYQLFSIIRAFLKIQRHKKYVVLR